uniref:Uncharacterized protein n=1 Tax=Globodera rostochiensis TaxID=31243 RepID=A0A914IBM7_GLORO
MSIAEDNNRKNIENIRRIDHCAKKVIEHCTHAALFNFSIEQNKWLKTEVDGPLFIYERSEEPLYALLIANRQSPRNFVEPITNGLQLRYESPYIFIHREDGSIRGVWVYGEDDCRRVFNMLMNLCSALKHATDGVKQYMPKKMAVVAATQPPPSSVANERQQSSKAAAVHGNGIGTPVVVPVKASGIGTPVVVPVKASGIGDDGPSLVDKDANNTATEKQKIGKVSKVIVPLLLDDDVVEIGAAAGDDDRNEEVVELEEDTAVVSSSMSSPPRATSGQQQQQQQQQQTTPEAFMMAASPPPYQDVGTHLRPVTFGDLERLKRELMDGFRQMLSNELTKFMETRSSTH